METKKEIIIYDYRTIKVRREMEAMTSDAYENLGWELIGSSVSGSAIFHVNLSFKRNRKIADKQHLLMLQEKVDATLANIEVLQNKKKSAGLTSALTTGIVGTLTLGGGMSMVLELGSTLGFMIGGIALGVVGIGICALAWLVHKKVKNRQLAKIEPMIEVEYNKLSDICEEINKK